ncbi:MAG: phosphoenolpyruvate kinase [Acidobacteria bacterium]|nr:MAG: phosphoenolpyruvate kinase [Acidobacteriota bacterium]
MSAPSQSRTPVHVVYGGAHLFSSDTPQKLGKIALRSLETYAPDLHEFAAAFGLDEDKKLLQTIYKKTVDKLTNEPVEDLRIDFEDGYGFRLNDEEDADARRASSELAKGFAKKSITPFCGFRIKSLAPETRDRAVRTFNIFFENFLSKTKNKLPANFVVTLPKVSHRDEVAELCRRIARVEHDAQLAPGSIGIEIMIETPRAFLDEKGRVALGDLVAASNGRCTSAHFGAYDYTSALGISAAHQHLRHPACDFARQMMLLALSPLGVRLVDSVTTRMPVALHKDAKLTEEQKSENRQSVHGGWREHFENVSASMANGFYQSWDLHPNQLVARYAAVYAFFLRSRDHDAERLRGFIEKSTKANLTGNTFDDAASANGLINFFRLGVDCGAFTPAEIKKTTGMSSSELKNMRFGF